MGPTHAAGAGTRGHPCVAAACVKAAQELLGWCPNIIHPVVLQRLADVKKYTVARLRQQESNLKMCAGAELCLNLSLRQSP